MLNENEKIRIRSEEELNLQHKGVIELTNFLEKEHLTWFLSGGTLLGAVRESDYIKWDWDVGVTLFTEELFQRKEEITEKLKNINFNIVKTDLTWENLKIVVTKYGAVYELLAWHKKGKYICRKSCRLPVKHYRGSSTVNLRDKTFRAPTEVEGLLAFNYGENWRVPIRTADKEEYNSERFIRGSKIVRIIKRKLRPLKKMLMG